MKTLHLMRHAKSAWDIEGQPDRERGLNRRGRRDAPRMGRALSRLLEPLPAHVSPARRAQLTLDGLCTGWPALGHMPHRTEEALYTFDAQALLVWLAEREAALDTMFLIGHNPALTDLVNALVGEPVLPNLPTAGYVRLALAIDRWGHLLQGCAELKYSLFPRQLGQD